MFRTLNCLIVLYALCPLLWVKVAWADTVLVAKRVELPGVSLQDVRARLAQGADAGTMQINLHASRADIPHFGLRKVGVAMQGSLHRDTQLRWLFDGTVQLSGAPGGALGNASVGMVIDESANTLEISADQGASHIGTAFPLDQPTHVQINLRDLPAAWLQGLIGTIWAGRVAGGKVNADLALDMRDDGFQSSGDLKVAELKYTTQAGNVLAQGLAGHARFSLDGTVHPAQLMLSGNMHGGELQLGPVHAQLPAHDVVLDLGATSEHGGLNITQLHMDDVDALRLNGSLAIDAKGNLQRVRLEHFQARFPTAYDRYGKPWLDKTTPHLQIAGQLSGHLDYASDAWRSFAFHSDGLNVAGGAGAWQVNGLHGDLDWSAQSDKGSTTLAWNQWAMRQVALGPAESHWRSRDGTLSLQSPLDLPVFNGHVHVSQLNWRPTAESNRFDLAVGINGIDMAALNQTIGWTPFPGTLDGTISSVHDQDNGYTLDGELTIKAFNGTATLNHLAVQQPLSGNAVWSGDMSLHQIDLAPLTDMFNFGNISGRLDGSISSLRLINGSPVAFAASLAAQNGGRMSLKAANNLSVITGGNPASGLQGAVMKLFKTLSYKRMGLKLSLQDGVCTLSGLDGNTNNYSIVEGTGLPYLHVTGTQTKIEWPVLMRRLKTATQGPIAER